MKAKRHLALTITAVGMLATLPVHADPLAVDSAVTGANYDSPFTSYVRDEDIEAGNWVEANDRVGAIGGWRIYLKQAQEQGSEKGKGLGQPATGHSMPGMDHSINKDMKR